LCIPVGQTPLQALALGIQMPAHSLVGAGQAGMHANPSQVTLPPPVGTWQAVHDVRSFGPQVATARLSTHLPPQRWKPVLHLTAQAPLTQAAAPLGSVGQLAQLVPQPVGSSSAAHRVPAPVPQTWVPAPQVKLHVEPLQLALAPVGLGQVVHDIPQVSTLVFMAQRPLQLWVPVGHTSEQGAVLAMQAPAQIRVPAGHVTMHCVPSQLTPPPVGF
jgi:hypothetical protein